jgi:hypothetical protein
MIRIEITAGSPLELAEAIRALSPLMTADTTAASEPDTTPAKEPLPESDTTPAKEPLLEPAEPPKQRRTRAKKENYMATAAETASAASGVESVEKPDTQLDIEDAIEKSAEPAEVGDEQDPAGRIAAANETAAGAPFTMTREEFKDWLIRVYLVDCIPSQNDRPAAFKALCEENGFKNFTETPDDKLPALKALADQKIKQLKNGGK